MSSMDRLKLGSIERKLPAYLLGMVLLMNALAGCSSGEVVPQAYARAEVSSGPRIDSVEFEVGGRYGSDSFRIYESGYSNIGLWNQYVIAENSDLSEAILAVTAGQQLTTQLDGHPTSLVIRDKWYVNTSSPTYTITSSGDQWTVGAQEIFSEIFSHDRLETSGMLVLHTVDSAGQSVVVRAETPPTKPLIAGYEQPEILELPHLIDSQQVDGIPFSYMVADGQPFKFESTTLADGKLGVDHQKMYVWTAHSDDNFLYVPVHNHVSSGQAVTRMSDENLIQVTDDFGIHHWYREVAVEKYQALSPQSSLSSFINLDDASGTVMTSKELKDHLLAFDRNDGVNRILFQTCIANGNPSWGRLFRVWEEVSNQK